MSATARQLEPQIAWAPFPGPQTAFLHCPVEDIFFGGARGPGKTDCLLAKWLLHADKYQRHAKGILFRESYPNLDEIIERTHALFPRFKALSTDRGRDWRFPNGARLKLRYLETDADAEEYHGHEYSWMGVDELGGFRSLKGLDRVRACLRSTAPGVVCQFVATGNPGGAGHNLIKLRYVDQARPGTAFRACATCDTAYIGERPRCDCEPVAHIERVFIPASLKDNPVLMQSVQYRRQLIASANGDDALLRAWLYGEWNITAGGMFDDLWRVARPVLAPFPIPPGWYVDRSFDWGDARPYACCWFAESNGEQVRTADGVVRAWPRGTLFVIGEEYGWNGRPNEGLRLANVEIARRVVATEAAMGLTGRVRPGPADTQIYAVDNNGRSIAHEMASAGVKWIEANKGQGSRVNGWSRIRSLLAANTELGPTGARRPRTKPMEEPGFFVFDRCVQTIRTLPSLPRDQRKRDDVDTQSEDHLGDAVRYRVLASVPRGGGAATKLGGV